VAALNAFVNASQVTFTNTVGALDDVTLSVKINDGGAGGTGQPWTTSTTIRLDVQPRGTVGTLGDDLMTGGKAADTLRGMEGADTLYGKAGNDILDGGAGADTMRGDDGRDTFVFGNDSMDQALDRILKFQHNKDKVDLSGIDADVGLVGDQAFIRVNAFSHHAGEALITVVKKVTTIALDVNGDGIADHTIQVQGALTASDWLL
jgi:Ca2+-binding RTX toxin-like protein